MPYEPRFFYDVDSSSVLQDAGLGATLGSVIPGVGTLIGGVGGAAIGLASGLFGKKKANNILKQNPYPTEPLPSEVTANQQIAQGQATEGLPSEQYQAAQRNIQRNQAAATAAAQTTPGGGVRNIGAIQQASNDATGDLNAKSAEMRRQNITQLLGVNQQAASWKDKLFDWNDRQKYIQNYNYGMGLLGQSNQNIMGGADKLLGTAAGAAASGLFGSSSPTRNYSAQAASYSPDLANTGATGPRSPANLFGSGPLNTTAPNYLNQ
jgi:hypothetical protein